MRKYLLLILLVITMPVRAENETVPKKFKNPIFNNIIYSENYNISHDSKVTPTYIKDLTTGYDEGCSYITEDDKAIFLKCHSAEKVVFKQSVMKCILPDIKRYINILKNRRYVECGGAVLI